MLLLYVHLFEWRKPPPEETSEPHVSKPQPHSAQTHTVKQVRHARSAHYLERRLFL
ncbi:MAG: hypothetical protein HC878_11100 [Leptolyngbyaceae cyanobacterium SL_5_14]|nr:hypothetical protein [Leptolyngbyaceae cyanobacterium SL_5_14]